jgi:multidrug efflux pump subunit AcrA (membrane-fusion protein)
MTSDTQPNGTARNRRVSKRVRFAIALGLIVVLATGVSPLLLGLLADQPENARPTRSESPPGPTADNSVMLNDAQLKAVKVAERLFEITHATVGSIDFNQENSLQVFTPYPGCITKRLAKAGDDVKKGQVLFDIDSPDLSTAEGTLIQAAAQLEPTTKVLKRAQELFAAKGAGAAGRGTGGLRP